MAIKKDFDSPFRNYVKPVKDRLGRDDIHALDRELKGYFIKKWVNFPHREEIEILDTRRWLVDRGALTPAGAIKVSSFKEATYGTGGKLITPIDCDPILYEQLMEDLDQWKRWCAKVAYARAKELEEREFEQ